MADFALHVFWALGGVALMFVLASLHHFAEGPP